MNILDWAGTTISECINDDGNKMCCSSKSLKQITSALCDNGEKLSAKNDTDILNEAKKKLGCDTEYCVLTKVAEKTNNPQIKSQLIKDLENNFKVEGPRNSTELTTNIQLDNVIQGWAQKYKSFYPLDFCMIDFEKTKKCALGRINIDSLFDGAKYTHAACVLNTDIDSGKGKHWVCIFIDDRTTPRSIEYFNSSGNPPVAHIMKWLTTTAKDMKKMTKVVIVSNRRLQYSKTECGLYCLFYILCRIRKIPYTNFRENNITDAHMIKFRKHVFTCV